MILTVQSRITHRSLMQKSKDELARQVLEACDREEAAVKRLKILAELCRGMIAMDAIETPGALEAELKIVLQPYEGW